MSLSVRLSYASLPASQNLPNPYLYKFLSLSKEFSQVWKAYAIDPWLAHIPALQAGSLGKCSKKFIKLSHEIEQNIFQKDGLQLLLILRELDHNGDLAPKIPSIVFEINERYWDTDMGKRLQEIYEDCTRIFNPEIRFKYNLGEREMLVLLNFFQHLKAQSLDQEVAQKLLDLIGR